MGAVCEGVRCGGLIVHISRLEDITLVNALVLPEGGRDTVFQDAIESRLTSATVGSFSRASLCDDVAAVVLVVVVVVIVVVVGNRSILGVSECSGEGTGLRGLFSSGVEGLAAARGGGLAPGLLPRGNNPRVGVVGLIGAGGESVVSVDVVCVVVSVVDVGLGSGGVVVVVVVEGGDDVVVVVLADSSEAAFIAFLVRFSRSS